MEKYLLIVDDEEDLREILSSIFSDEGYQILTAANGQEALNIMKSEDGKKVCTIISDISMPIMTGLVLLKSLRDAEIETPFILVTGYGDKEKAVQALNFGAYDFQDKPFDRIRLINSVKSATQVWFDQKEIEKEVNEIMAKNKMPEVDCAKTRHALKSILLLRYQRRELASDKKK